MENPIVQCPWETVWTEQKYVDVLILKLEWENDWWEKGLFTFDTQWMAEIMNQWHMSSHIGFIW